MTKGGPGSQIKSGMTRKNSLRAWIPDQVWDDKEKQPEGLDPE